MKRQAAKHSFLSSFRNQARSSSASSVSFDSDAYCMASYRVKATNIVQYTGIIRLYISVLSVHFRGER